MYANEYNSQMYTNDYIRTTPALAYIRVAKSRSPANFISLLKWVALNVVELFQRGSTIQVTGGVLRPRLQPRSELRYMLMTRPFRLPRQ
jgi:hypothetical protein